MTTDAATDAATDAGIAAAYSAAGTAWRDGPALVYDRLAEDLVARCPVPVAGASVLDIGSGTGAGSRAARRAGARSVLAVDLAAGMLEVDRATRPPAAVGDATRLPFRPASFDVALAAFSFNHLADPAAGLAAAARVVRPGGAVVASAYAADDGHPVKAAVEAALQGEGWEPDPWQVEMHRDRAPRLASEDGARLVARGAGVDEGATIETVRVPFPDLTPRDWVAWRLGMAQHAGFVERLGPARRAAVVDRALELLGADPPPLERVVVVISVRC